MVGVELTDTLNGFRTVRRPAVLAVGLREDGHTIEPEMVMKMLRHGYRVANASSHEYSRQHGRSNINIWREWPKFVRSVIMNLFRRDRRTGPNGPRGEPSARLRPEATRRGADADV